MTTAQYNAQIGLVPLVNFGAITDNLFRSAQPHYAYQFDWIKDVLKVDATINLRAEKEIDGHYIDTMTIPVVDHHPPTITQAMEFINRIRYADSVGMRLLMHCEHGHGRTSTFSVLAKVALGMNLADAIQDEHDRFHFEFKHHAQEEWLEKNFEKYFLPEATY